MFIINIFSFLHLKFNYSGFKVYKTVLFTKIFPIFFRYHFVKVSLVIKSLKFLSIAAV